MTTYLAAQDLEPGDSARVGNHRSGACAVEPLEAYWPRTFPVTDEQGAVVGKAHLNRDGTGRFAPTAPVRRGAKLTIPVEFPGPKEQS